jgi:hypothetical protein
VRAALGRALTRSGGRGEGRPFARAAGLLAAGSVRAERLDGFARVERMMAEGWRGYLEARFAESAARLEEARGGALAIVDLPGGPELMADVSLRLGAARLALGRDREAARDFQLAARLDPTRPVTDAEFKPQVVARFERERGEARARRVRRIEVHPGGAQVEVDGRAAGRAPVALELDEGGHVLVARAPGWTARAVLVDVEASGAEAVGIELEADRVAALAGRGRAGMRIGQEGASETAAAVMMFGELDGVLMAASVWRSGRPALLGQYCGGAPLACGRVVEIVYRPGSLDRVAAELWREARQVRSGATLVLLADARLVHREGGPGRARAGGEDGRWWQSRWLWLGVGGAAVSAAAAALVLSGGGDEAWTASFGECEFGGC